MTQKPFHTKSGRDYRTAGTLDFEKFTKFLHSKGYSQIELNQQRRHITGSLYHDGSKYFVKIATTLGIAENTQNDAAWCKKIYAINPTSFQVPKIVEEIEYGELFGYICDFIPFLPITTKQPFLVEKFNHLIPVFTQILIELLSITALDLPQDTKYIRAQNENHSIGNWLYQKALGYQQLLPNTIKCEELLELIMVSESKITGALNHGDFTPWHILYSEGNLPVLIDGELAASDKPKYYDLAYIFERIYVNANQPNSALLLLSDFQKRLSQEERVLFNGEFYPVLAQRAVGSYLDAIHAGKVDFTLQDGFQKYVIDSVKYIYPDPPYQKPD